MKQKPKRVFSTEQKAYLLNTYDNLPLHDGSRGQFMKDNRFGWKMMNNWRNTPAVRAAMRDGKNTPPPPEVPNIHVSDLPTLEVPAKDGSTKRTFTLRQKADFLAHYDALPYGSEERGKFLNKYGIYWNMLSRWRTDLKRERIPIPNLKLKRTLANGHADIDRPPVRGGPRPGAGRPRKSPGPAKKNSSGHFQTAEDVIDWLTIQIEERSKIREELIEHAGKTRNE